MKSVIAPVLTFAAVILMSDPALSSQDPTAAGVPAPSLGATPAATPQPPAGTNELAKPGERPKTVLHVSKDYIKKLANYGYYPKNDKGQMVFCKKDAQLGSRFERERCMDGDQLAMFLEKAQAQRDGLKIPPCSDRIHCQGK
jgi:hypothetical protein